ncbi:uncharacterized protein BDZ99DRAFT_198133 [Mytilinidion resinicola]|uniref:Uncharacterized protein n=1 Tax=Mytilinidion resinicola TaxID=574789 RepID=A0A6A6Z355_9PEZI|nr:uncharacterized protein BDZ99DRAFT_198133 [Mytilinidion resinicola]KAF2815536.1 hypothetical protein BDZ99DRAFT_198133 [Mytilinidion resinicola]
MPVPQQRPVKKAPPHHPYLARPYRNVGTRLRHPALRINQTEGAGQASIYPRPYPSMPSWPSSCSHLSHQPPGSTRCATRTIP